MDSLATVVCCPHLSCGFNEFTGWHPSLLSSSFVLRLSPPLKRRPVEFLYLKASSCCYSWSPSHRVNQPQTNGPQLHPCRLISLLALLLCLCTLSATCPCHLPYMLFPHRGKNFSVSFLFFYQNEPVSHLLSPECSNLLDYGTHTSLNIYPVFSSPPFPPSRVLFSLFLYRSSSSLTTMATREVVFPF